MGGEAIKVANGTFTSETSGRQLDIVDEIPNCFVPAEFKSSGALKDITEMVKSFYEETPFPNYDDFDSRESLATKAGRWRFAALLDEQISDGALVLDAGCGTGQLSDFLGMPWKRKVFAGDLCLNSLRLAKGQMFKPHSPSAVVTRSLSQLAMLLSGGGRDGGPYIMIGRKR